MNKIKRMGWTAPVESIRQIDRAIAQVASTMNTDNVSDAMFRFNEAGRLVGRAHPMLLEIHWIPEASAANKLSQLLQSFQVKPRVVPARQYEVQRFGKQMYKVLLAFRGRVQKRMEAERGRFEGKAVPDAQELFNELPGAIESWRQQRDPYVRAQRLRAIDAMLGMIQAQDPRLGRRAFLLWAKAR